MNLKINFHWFLVLVKINKRKRTVKNAGKILSQILNDPKIASHFKVLRKIHIINNDIQYHGNKQTNNFCKFQLELIRKRSCCKYKGLRRETIIPTQNSRLKANPRLHVPIDNTE